MATSRTRVGVLGAGGRMGQAIIAALADDPRLCLAGAIERSDHPAVGRRLGASFPAGMTICSNHGPLANASDVLIDFTSPDALASTLDAACGGRAAIVIGTTGLGAREQALIDRAARSIPVLQAANMTLGVALLERLVEAGARALGTGWDIEIAELHHRDKIDAPSGTALALGAAAARGRGVTLERVRAQAQTRGGGGGGGGRARAAGEIGFASLRGGSAAGDHAVMLLGRGERIELRHIAEDRAIFATGALAAAAWLAGRPAGRYTMGDVLDMGPI